MNEEDMLAWRRHVLENEGLGDWALVRGEPYCWHEDKKIMVYPDTPPCLFLHEVAHALYPHQEGHFHNHYHGGHWAFWFGMLVDKYMEVRSMPVLGPPVTELPPPPPPAGPDSGQGGTGG
jgi:hypothetical protein